MIRLHRSSYVLLLGISLICHAGWQDDVPGARLAGQGTFSWFGFNLYHARLWSATSPFEFDRPFALELTYRRSISRERLVNTSMDEMARQTSCTARKSNEADWRAGMQRAFADVSSGDRFTGVYLPETGARFYLNGRKTTDINDPAFARCFFAIWLGVDARSPELRAELIGKGRAG
ncbi:chalcone isomerase family protein [Burkholderiaceae bacterium DAT-1]|nr:chalcone isomerase family protein [Burkholderiaceae bacterium DAT-1]